MPVKKFSELNLPKSRKTSQKSLKKAKQLRKEVRKLAKNTQQIAHPPKNKGKVKGYKSAKRITSPKKKDKKFTIRGPSKVTQNASKIQPTKYNHKWTNEKK